MNSRLVILGLLREKPYHGYEIKQTMKERYMHEWTEIPFGSIYSALKRLTGQGFIQEDGVEKVGNRPSRTIYSISESGRKEFLALLREGWQLPDSPPSTLRICVVFMQALPPDEIGRYLERRIQILASNVKHIQDVRNDVIRKGEGWAVRYWTAQYVASFDIAVANRTIQWAQELLHDIRSGRSSWNADNV
jgi:DNA-binding PadR family transcriptional regulator